MAVTIAKYETPKHRDIHKLGIKPDKEILQHPITREEIGTQDDLQYQAAVELLAKNSPAISHSIDILHHSQLASRPTQS